MKILKKQKTDYPSIYNFANLCRQLSPGKSSVLKYSGSIQNSELVKSPLKASYESSLPAKNIQSGAVFTETDILENERKLCMEKDALHCLNAHLLDTTHMYMCLI